MGVALRTAALALALALVAIGALPFAQSALQRRNLQAEAAEIAARPFVREPGKPVVVVTGSSTVRLWRSSEQAFPEAQVVNTGFGGSTMDALAAHADGLILRYQPDQVFIGSGDNDLAAGRSPEQVLADTRALVARLQRELPTSTIAIIAAKPSLQRWYLRDDYQKLNAGFRALAAQHEQVQFVDVWSRLVDDDGQVRPELYMSDGLHLNKRGYRIYSAALRAAGLSFSASE